MYTVTIKRSASKKLSSLRGSTRAKIAGAINMLGINPDDQRLDIKKLQGVNGYKVRLGPWLIIYNRDYVLQIIEIVKIGSRGDLYK